MPRRARLVLPGSSHHIIQRGSRRRTVFVDDSDHAHYKTILRTRCDQTGVLVACYCLMPNHVHIIAVPSDPEGLSHAFGRAHADYARFINRREKWSDHLWQDRFSSFVMDEPYFRACVSYVVSNPVRAGLVRRLIDWPYSSARAQLLGEPDGLVDRSTLVRFGLDGSAARIECSAHEMEEFRRSMTSGRPLGSPESLRTAEQKLGCSLAVATPGRPPRVGGDARV